MKRTATKGKKHIRNTPEQRTLWVDQAVLRKHLQLRSPAPEQPINLVVNHYLQLADVVLGKQKAA